MTLPSQFSLEEENFYKDIQDLVKKGSKNEKELSSFLERYMDLLARADLDDETFIINFTKAGLIIEASAKVYGTKVDRLWINLEHVLESLKNKSQGQCKKKTDCEDEAGDDIDMDGGCDDVQDEGKRKLASTGRRRKKIGDALFSSDDFIEIDNVTGLLGKNMNERSIINESKIKLCEKVPNMFIKNKTKKKKIDVCLNKFLDDKDVIRLRDWIISSEGLLIKELYTPLPEISVSMANLLEEEIKDGCYDSDPCLNGTDVFEDVQESLILESMKMSDDFKNEKNNNNEIEISDRLKKSAIGEKHSDLEEKDDVMDELNISKESELAKFPNVLDRFSEDCLVDVDEVFWNPSKFQDVIPSKKMRLGKTTKLQCQLCADKKAHKRKGRKCIEEKSLNCLDSYFTPHVQAILSEHNFRILPDEELYDVFKTEMKLIGHLEKVNTCKNINEAYHPNESPEELRNFLGFDGMENYLMKRAPDLQDDEIIENDLVLDNLEDGNDNYVGDSLPDKEFELPFPVTETSIKPNFLTDNDPDGKSSNILSNSESEYQKLVMEGLKDHYAAKSSFAKNKELGIKISKWHELIADKIELSQKRGALNMNVLAEKIMNIFPPCVNGERPVMTFKELVENQSRRDIPRYFFACLQLTNEGNLDIGKSSSKPLVTDCVVVTQLRTSRMNYELEECSSKSPSKKLLDSGSKFAQVKRKRNLSLSSMSVLESKEISKKKKINKSSNKRPKNFDTTNYTKRRRCSVSSVDSVLSE